MRLSNVTNFAIEVNGSCFICLEEISPLSSSPKIKTEPDSGLNPASNQTTSSTITTTPPHFSLHCLSNFLNLDKTKVFSGGQDDSSLSSHLIEKVNRSRLTVELCLECASLNEEFSKLYHQLEKIKMEILSQLGQLHEKFLTAAEVKNVAHVIGRSENINPSREEHEEKLKIAIALRTETILNCSRKLNSPPPRVKVAKLSDMDVLRQTRSTSGNTKQEPSTSELTYKSTQSGNITEFSNDLKMESASFDINSDNDDFGEENSEDLDHETDPLNESESPPEIPVEPFHHHPQVSTKNVLNPLSNMFILTESGACKCRLCSREMGVRSFRTHYLEVHVGVRFKCEVCGKIYTKKGNLKVHHEFVHLQKQFSCQFCSKTFTSSKYRNYHVIRGICRLRNEAKAKNVKQKQQN